MFRRWVLVLLGCAALALGATSCDDDDDDNAGPGTQPLISQITATPEIVDAGGAIAVSVTASGEGLTYLWTASGGSFADATAPATTWSAPATPGVYTLTCSARASNNLTSSSSKAVGVEIGLQLVAQATSVTIANRTRVVALAVGSGLTYQWLASAGTITNVTADTVMWQAPDTVPLQVPYVQVIVADAQGNARTEKLDLAVAPYTPAETPVYMGDAYCGVCHVGTHAAWANESGHAGAYASLAEIGMQNNAYCLGCHTVGTVAAGAADARANGGYDEIPVTALRNVQCENCHGPGGDHPGTTPRLPATLAAVNCGVCHNGAHHPTYDEWQSSGHADVIALEGGYPGGPAFNRSCAKCHNGRFGATYLDNPPGFTNPAAVAQTDADEMTCAVCHDPHGNGNMANLRDAAVTDVVLPDGSVIPEAGAGRLCMACHNGRRTPTNINSQINDGTAHFGPHHSCQGDMLAGTGAYEAINPTFPWGSSTHLRIEDGCVSCHTHGHEGEGGGPNYTGHDFQPTVEACERCHGAIEDFAEVAAVDDYDGDGAVEGVQHEVEGLLELLKEAILDASDTPEHRTLLETDWEANIGNIAVSTVDQRKAAYNHEFVEFDQSRGVHNAKYAIQLLQQSILFLEPAAKAAARWTLLVD